MRELDKNTDKKIIDYKTKRSPLRGDLSNDRKRGFLIPKEQTGGDSGINVLEQPHLPPEQLMAQAFVDLDTKVGALGDNSGNNVNHQQVEGVLGAYLSYRRVLARGNHESPLPLQLADVNLEELSKAKGYRAFEGGKEMLTRILREGENLRRGRLNLLARREGVEDPEGIIADLSLNNSERLRKAERAIMFQMEKTRMNTAVNNAIKLVLES